jgi:hypothetical protein
MAAYARQARDTEMVEWATEIKVRAERKAGEMLAEVERTPGKRKNGTSLHHGAKSLGEVISENDIPRITAHRWQKLAAIPEDNFERANAPIVAAPTPAHRCACC